MGVTLTDNFPEAISKIETAVELLIARTAADVERRAKAKAPYDTGNLRNSIQATPVGPGHWRVEVGAEYAAYVEYGTSRMAAQPYLTPAVEEASAELRVVPIG